MRDRELAQEGLGRLEVGGQDLPSHLEQLEHPWVADPVEDTRAYLSGVEHTLASEHSEVLRGAARVKAESHLQLSHAPLPVAEEFQDAHPRRMTKDPKELRLDDMDWTTTGRRRRRGLSPLSKPSSHQGAPSTVRGARPLAVLAAAPWMAMVACPTFRMRVALAWLDGLAA
jgi:hypothetical protein